MFNSDRRNIWQLHEKVNGLGLISLSHHPDSVLVVVISQKWLISTLLRQNLGPT